jgi:hypothetical protein
VAFERRGAVDGGHERQAAAPLAAPRAAAQLVAVIAPTPPR